MASDLFPPQPSSADRRWLDLNGELAPILYNAVIRPPDRPDLRLHVQRAWSTQHGGWYATHIAISTGATQ